MSTEYLTEAFKAKSLSKVGKLVATYVSKQTNKKVMFVIAEEVKLDGGHYTQLAFASVDGHAFTILFKPNVVASSTAVVSMVNYFKPGKSFYDTPDLTIEVDPTEDRSLAKLLPIIPRIILGKVKVGDTTISLTESALTEAATNQSQWLKSIPVKDFESIALLLANSSSPVPLSTIEQVYGQVGVDIATTLVENAGGHVNPTAVSIYGQAADTFVSSVFSGEAFSLVEGALISSQSLEEVLNESISTSRLIDYMLAKTSSGVGFTRTEIHHDLSLKDYKVAAELIRSNDYLFTKKNGKLFVINPNEFKSAVQSIIDSINGEQNKPKVKVKTSTGYASIPIVNATGLPDGLDMGSSMHDIERVSFEEQLEDLQQSLRVFLKNRSMYLFLLGGIGGVGKCLPPSYDLPITCSVIS